MELTGIRIDSVTGQTLTTHIFVRQGDRELGLDARPSDAVAMALSGGARIFATRTVMARAADYAGRDQQ